MLEVCADAFENGIPRFATRKAEALHRKRNKVLVSLKKLAECVDRGWEIARMAVLQLGQMDIARDAGEDLIVALRNGALVVIVVIVEVKV